MDVRSTRAGNRAQSGSEGALRGVALGRKNDLFAGHERAGEHLAVLCTLVATCVACDVNPLAYLRDVLIRVQTHPASRVDDLLPDRWHAGMDEPLAATA